MKKDKIKNLEIHQGLPNQIVREYLAEADAKAYYNYCNVKKEVILFNDYADDMDQFNIENLKAEIAHREKKLQYARQMKAIKTLIADEGWKIHDVSDYVLMQKPYFINFVGTDAEYKQLLKTIK